MRSGDWMQTWTGGRFWPLDPKVEEMDVRDIAHSLSMQCRYAGHLDRFYSVAEHCVLVSQVVAPTSALTALLHDATEAYVVDVPRPLKGSLVGYRDIEDRVWTVIAEKFGIDPEWPSDVRDADNRIILNERNALMSRAERGAWNQDGMDPLPLTIHAWDAETAEIEWLSRLAELTTK